MARKSTQTRKRVTFNLNRRDWLTIQRICRIIRQRRGGKDPTPNQALHNLLCLARLILRKQRDGCTLAIMRGESRLYIVAPFDDPSSPFGPMGERFVGPPQRHDAGEMYPDSSDGLPSPL